MTKIISLVMPLFFVFNLGACRLSPLRLAGDFVFDKKEQHKLIGAPERKLIEQAFQGVDRSRLRDVHVHLVGVGHGDSGIKISEHFSSLFHLKSFVRFYLFLTASGLKKTDRIDQQYIERLEGLIRDGQLNFKHHILAFDKHYDVDGQVVPEHTEMYIPNQYSWDLSQKDPDIFEPTISVHPYRKDAIDEINKWGQRGVKYIKWLPNAMGIDPSHESLDAFYQAVKKWDMTILSHTGIEKSVEAENFQGLGNPLLLRKPLDMGVKIIAAHCASKGEFPDLEKPGQQAKAHHLLFRLLRNPKYKDLLKVDISAVMTADRLDGALLEMLEAKDLQPHFVYASDYPVPAVNVFIPLKKMAKKGLILPEQVVPLRHIYKVNPLLFNFVLMRLIKHPKSGQKFSLEAFYF